LIAQHYIFLWFLKAKQPYCKGHQSFKQDIVGENLSIYNILGVLKNLQLYIQSDSTHSIISAYT